MAASNRQQPPGAQAAQQALSAANPTGELCRAGPAHQEFRWALRSTRALRSTLLIFFFFFYSKGNIQLEPELQGLHLNQKQ